MNKINWYPGHMKKTKNLISENLSLVSAVIEVVDARIPLASRNPDIAELTKGKTRIVVLNKSDLADPVKTKEWESKLKEENILLNDNNTSQLNAIFSNNKYAYLNKIKLAELIVLLSNAKEQKIVDKVKLLTIVDNIINNYKTKSHKKLMKLLVEARKNAS